MKVRQMVAECIHCSKPFSCQVYSEGVDRGWTLFSDGYLYHPFSCSPWHSIKICPHCSQNVEVVDDELVVEADGEMPRGDIYSPRDRIRKELSLLSENQGERRRDLMIMDMWVSNHICGSGADEYTTMHMKELLDVENDLDLVIRADIQRQLGRFEAAREGLLTVQRASKSADRRRKLHIQAVLAFVSRKVREAMPVLSEGDFVAPTGRLAIHKRVVYKA
jgi:hypothetical protein